MLYAGLPPKSPFDKQYAMNTKIHDDQYEFQGYTNSYLYFNKSRNMWYLRVKEKNKSVWATTSVGDYPIGKQIWRVEAPALGGSFEMHLNACSDESEYNCDDGTCILIDWRLTMTF